MVHIEIEDVDGDIDEMVDVLERISAMIKEGYTSGYYPTWSITVTEDEEDGEDEEE